jgi:7,8-dihydropterin-6-yl-methyl-4-(beta-D-ribofuranosyl)aminobenzene 5'-phosphate synthase
MASFLKLIVINDNEPGEGLRNEWGWSILVESDKRSLLFDADTNPSVIEYNTNKLGVDIRALDFAFLSHYHRDHYGGFSYVGRKVPGLRVYVPPRGEEFLRYWNLEPVVIHKGQRIEEDIWSSGPMGLIEEQALGIEVENLGLVVIVGCSHPGVDVLARRLMELSHREIYLVIGGFHSPSRRTLDNLAKISQYIYPAHCTGEAGKRYIKRKYPEKYREVRTGSVIKIGED